MELYHATATATWLLKHGRFPDSDAGRREVFRYPRLLLQLSSIGFPEDLDTSQEGPSGRTALFRMLNLSDDKRTIPRKKFSHFLQRILGHYRPLRLTNFCAVIERL